MSTVLTVRIEPALLSEADARAARMGLDRATYVRNLIKKDLTSEDKPRGFASEDLVGIYRLGGGSAANVRVRENLRRKAAKKRESNR